MPPKSFLQWCNLPKADLGAETTMENDGQFMVTRLMSLVTARADDVPEWVDI